MQTGQLYSRWEVSHWSVEDEEPGGADPKLWLRDDADQRWLFKPVTIPRNRNRQGEDWSEKAAAELADLLAIPCARVELAARGQSEGSISLNVRPPEYEMHSGATFLAAARAPRFRPARELLEEQSPDLKLRPGHSLENIRNALEGFAPPPHTTLPAQLGAFDTFTGYLVLDALIANRDRHDENWSVLLPATDAVPPCLSPSYDQAGGLGFNLTDERRLSVLRRGPAGFHDYSRRGTAWRFESVPGAVPTLVAHACDALALASAPGRAHWVRALSDLEVQDLDPIFEGLPMSDPERRFAQQLLQTNLERLRDECRDRGWL